MPSEWVNHVKAYAKKHNVTYMCAISDASKTYKKKAVVKKAVVKKAVVKKAVKKKAVVKKAVKKAVAKKVVKKKAVKNKAVPSVERQKSLDDMKKWQKKYSVKPFIKKKHITNETESAKSKRRKTESEAERKRVSALGGTFKERMKKYSEIRDMINKVKKQIQNKKKIELETGKHYNSFPDLNRISELRRIYFLKVGAYPDVNPSTLGNR